MRRIAAPVVLLATLAFGSNASAQEPLQESPPGLDVLEPGNAVRLSTSETARQNGTYLGYRSESLVIRQSNGSSFEVPMRTVRTLHVRDGATWEAAWKSSIIGGATGAVWTILVSATDCPTPSTCTSDYWPRMGIDAGIGMAVGAAAGAAVGSLLHRWERVFP